MMKQNTFRCGLLLALLAPSSALTPAFEAVIEADLAVWQGSTFSVAIARRVASEIGVTLFRVEQGGAIYFEAGLDHRQRQWVAFFERILPAAAARAVHARFPFYMLFHGWDEPVGRQNEAECNETHGQLHANLWNPHIGHVQLPFFSVTKVPGCHTDILIPQDQIFIPESVLPVQWADRVPKLFFRGSSTGSGKHFEHQGTERSHRYRFVKLLRDLEDMADVRMLDVPGHYQGERVPVSHWSRYKYILNLGGQSYGLRTATTARTNCTLVEANIYVDLITASIAEFEHYIRVRFDGSDVVELLQWLRGHDSEAERMGQRLREHYERHFTDDALIDYTVALLTRYSRAIMFEG
jgi:hypothetical protein